MDVIVTRPDRRTPNDPVTWKLTDLLGRSMGSIHETAQGRFTIRPAGQAVQTMLGIGTGPFASLDDALAEIERHTRGVCRRLPGEDRS